MIQTACVIGAGAYGTALAEVFSKKVDVQLVSRNAEVAKSINEKHANPRCLCNVTLNKNITCICDYAPCKNADLIFIVTPVAAVRSVCGQIKNITNAPVVLCSKGIELNSCLLTTEIARKVGLKNKLCVLSGPSFAHEIACDMPAAVSIAGHDTKLLASLQDALSTDTFRIVTNTDIIGTQLCGAMKNVLAILCGTYIGASKGQSSIAMLITEALHEICGLLKQAGGKESTAYELCGIGDILLTCTNEASRNVKFGKFLANGGTIKNWEGDLAEGSLTAAIIPQLEQRFNYKLPILRTTYNMIYGN